jgi:hypothetical protein
MIVWKRLFLIVLASAMATGFWHLVGRAGSPFHRLVPISWAFHEDSPRAFLRITQPGTVRQLEIKCIRKNPSVNTPSWVEDECSIMREISDENYMHVIDLFDLPGHRCIANDSQFLQR